MMTWEMMTYSTQLLAGEWRQTVQVRSKEIKQQTHLLFYK